MFGFFVDVDLVHLRCILRSSFGKKLTSPASLGRVFRAFSQSKCMHLFRLLAFPESLLGTCSPLHIAMFHTCKSGFMILKVPPSKPEYSKACPTCLPTYAPTLTQRHNSFTTKKLGCEVHPWLGIQRLRTPPLLRATI